MASSEAMIVRGLIGGVCIIIGRRVVYKISRDMYIATNDEHCIYQKRTIKNN